MSDDIIAAGIPTDDAVNRGRGTGSFRARGSRGRSRGRGFGTIRTPTGHDPPYGSTSTGAPRTQDHIYPSVATSMVVTGQPARVNIDYGELKIIANDVHIAITTRFKSAQIQAFAKSQFIGYCYALLAKRLTGILESRPDQDVDYKSSFVVPTTNIPAPIYAYLSSIGDYIDPFSRRHELLITRKFLREIMFNAHMMYAHAGNKYIWYVLGDTWEATKRTFHKIIHDIMGFDVTIDDLYSFEALVAFITDDEPFGEQTNADATSIVQFVGTWIEALRANPDAAVEPAIAADASDDFKTMHATITTHINSDITNVMHLPHVLNENAPLDFTMSMGLTSSLAIIPAVMNFNSALPNTFIGSPALFGWNSGSAQFPIIIAPMQLPPTFIGMAAVCKFRLFKHQGLNFDDNWTAQVQRTSINNMRTTWIASSLKN